MAGAPPIHDASRAPRRTAGVLGSLVLFVLAPLSWWVAIDVPELRSSALTVWVLLGAALALALWAAARDRRGWVRVVAVLELAFAALFLWAFFGLQRTPEAHLPVQAPDFTLSDEQGRAVTLSTELARGPVLLVFTRGHWCPVCRSELRGLAEVDSALKQRGGRLLAISVDAPADSRAVVHDLALPFPILSDSERTVIRAFGLVHEGGGPEGETIAVPAQLLVERDGTIAWRHVARRITERASPARTLEALAKLGP